MDEEEEVSREIEDRQETFFKRGAAKTVFMSGSSRLVKNKNTKTC